MRVFPAEEIELLALRGGRLRVCTHAHAHKHVHRDGSRNKMVHVDGSKAGDLQKWMRQQGWIAGGWAYSIPASCSGKSEAAGAGGDKGAAA